MKYFIDTEFLEGKQNKTFLGFKYGETKSTIDLISIGIVAEDGRELYLISKEFNLKEAWNRYDLLEANTSKNHTMYDRKVYWIRENVLKPIHYELSIKEAKHKLDYINWCKLIELKDGYSNRHYKTFKKLINKYGKTNKEIAENILWFCAAEKSIFETDGLGQEVRNRLEDNPVKFYGYYSDYDWVVFCWLFGKMIDLPTGFPKYCIDLKQELDKKALYMSNKEYPQYITEKLTLHGDRIKLLEKHKDYPKQTGIHHALNDAKWNKELYEFLQKL